MGNSQRKNNLITVKIVKGTVQDNFGKKYTVDFVGDDDDFVNISYYSEEKKNSSSIKVLLSQNQNEIYDICFINNYSYLLVGCNKGYLYVYKRKNNGKANLIFNDLICKFRPNNDDIIQLIKLQSGHLLILCRDSSAKVLKIEIDINGILYEDKKKCQVIQTLLEEGEPSENSGIELNSGNLIISQGYFINFFEKKENSESISNSDIVFLLTKKIFTNSDNINIIKIDSKTIVASQISNNSLDFYDINNHSLIKRVDRIEFGNNKNIMCLINKDTLAVGGNNGIIYLIDTLRKQLFNISHIDNCGIITCIKPIEINNIIIASFDSNNKSNDLIVCKIKENNNFEEIKRKNKVHDDKIIDIKLITMSISKNWNNFVNNYNVITIGKEHKIKLVLNDA